MHASISFNCYDRNQPERRFVSDSSRIWSVYWRQRRPEKAGRFPRQSDLKQHFNLIKIIPNAVNTFSSTKNQLKINPSKEFFGRHYYFNCIKQLQLTMLPSLFFGSFFNPPRLINSQTKFLRSIKLKTYNIFEQVEQLKGIRNLFSSTKRWMN